MATKTNSTFDPAKAKLGSRLKAPGITYALAFDAEKQRLFGAGSDRAVYRVDLNQKKPQSKKAWQNHSNYVSAIELHGKTLVSGGYDGKIIWTDISTGKVVRAVDAHKKWIRDFALRGRHLASVGDDMLVKLWDVESGKLMKQFAGHRKITPEGFTTALYAVAISPDGQTIASGDRVGSVCIWDSRSGKLLRRIQASAFYTYDPVKRSRSMGGIRGLLFSDDGNQLGIAGIGAVTNVDGFVGPCRIELWDWRAAKQTFAGQDKHNAILNDLAFVQDDSLLIAAGGGDSGGVITFWDLKQKKLVHKVKPKGHIQQFVVDSKRNQILACGHAGFQIWKV